MPDLPVPPQRLPHVSNEALRRYRRVMAWLQWLSPWLAARVGMWLFLRPSRRRIEPRDAATLAQARTWKLRLEGEDLRVYEWSGGTRLAILAHGWGSHVPRFAPLIEALRAAGYRVVAFDAPGHGQSTGRRSSLPQFGAALAAVLAHTGPAQLMVGHSLGALAIALAVGDGRVAMPEALVLIAMPSGAPFLIDRYEQMFGIDAATSRRFLQRFTHRFSEPPEHFTARRVATTLALPVLLVHDELDDVVPIGQARELARALPRARLHVSHGLGHSNLLRDATTIGIIADFAREIG